MLVPKWPIRLWPEGTDVAGSENPVTLVPLLVVMNALWVLQLGPLKVPTIVPELLIPVGNTPTELPGVHVTVRRFSGWRLTPVKVLP